MHINELNPERVLFFGDIHGSVEQLRRALDRAEELDINVTVQVGDFGIWPGEHGQRFLEVVRAETEARKIWVLFVDGNHEDFPQLYSYPVDPDDGTRPLGQYVAHLPRGLRWTWQGLRFAAMGGAHSVDRQHRVEDVSWWVEEWASDTELISLKNGEEVDVLVMHDSPAGAPNPVLDDPIAPLRARQWIPEHDLYLAALHRKRLAEAVNPLNPYWLFHGHYHKRGGGSYAPGNRICQVVGLDEGGTRFIDDFVFVADLEQLAVGSTDRLDDQ